MPLPLVTRLMEQTQITLQRVILLEMMSTIPTVLMRLVSLVRSSPSTLHPVRRCLRGGVVTDKWLSVILPGLRPGKTLIPSLPLKSTLLIHRLTTCTIPLLIWVSVLQKLQTSLIQYQALVQAIVSSTSHCRNHRTPLGSFFID